MSKLKIERVSVLMVLGAFIFATNTRAGENVWTSEGPYGASVKTIAFNPLNNNIILIGTIQNGIYKSTDAGENWRHIDSDVIYINQREIIYNPMHPDTVFAATAGGVYRSDNGGETWENISPPGRENQEFRAIKLDPLHPNKLLIGGVGDRWKSIDSGNNWSVFRINPQLPEGFDHEVDDIEIDPITTNIAYLVTPDAETGYGIFKSTDFGDTWINIQHNSDSCAFGIDIAIDPVNPNIVYYGKNTDIDPDCPFLLKSTDGGGTWFDITPPILEARGVDKIAISPFDHNIIFLATSTNGILKSTDAGQNWSEINNGLGLQSTATIEVDAITGDLYLGIYNDGIYKSTNGGESWRRISQNILGIGGENLAFFADSTHSPVVAINRGCYYRNDDFQNWQLLETPVPFQSRIKSIATDKYLPSNLYLAIRPSAFLFTTNRGQTWEFGGDGLPQYGYFESMTISYGTEPDRRIFLAAYGVYRSDNLGLNFELCESGLPQQYYYGVYSSSQNFEFIAATDLENRVFISTDRGESWQETNDMPRLNDVWIEDFQFDPNDAYHIFASTTGYGLFESYDLGQHWGNINNDLPLGGEYPTIFGPAINPYNSLNIFVASSQRGIYQTFDGGFHWAAFGTGLDTSFLGGYLYFAPDDTTRLYYATFDHSVWSIHRTLDGINDDTEPLPSVLSLSSFPNPFNPATTINYSLPREGEVSITVYNITGQKVATVLDSYRPAGEHSLVWNAAAYPSGLYFARMQSGEYCSDIKMLLVK